MKRILLLLAATAVLLSNEVYGATGCTYPTALDTFPDRTTGASTYAEWNKSNCMAEKIQAELGTDPSGPEATVAARLAKTPTAVPVPTNEGGTAIDTSGSTGTARVDGGVWTVTSLRYLTTAGITASTIQTQGQGALTASINQVATVANANDTVTLPAAITGRRVTVLNDGVNTLQIFPAPGDNLGEGLDTATTLETKGSVVFVAYDTTNWRREQDLPRYTAAQLATKTGRYPGQRAIVSDGEHAGSEVYWDAVGGKYRCTSELDGVIFPGCPPYNAVVGADSCTALAAVYDRAEEWATVSGQRPLKIKFLDVYKTQCAGKYEVPAGGSLLLTLEGNGHSSGLECDFNGTGTAGACLTAQAESGVGNGFFMADMRIRGGSTNYPEELLYLNNLAQSKFIRASVSNFKKYAIHTNLVQHFVFGLGLLTENQAANADSCYFYFANNDAEISVATNSVESNTGSNLSFVCLGNNDLRDISLVGNVGTAGGLKNFLNFIGTTRLDRMTALGNAFNNVSVVVKGNTNSTGARKKLIFGGNTFTSDGTFTFGIELVDFDTAIFTDNILDGFGVPVRLNLVSNSNIVFRGNTITDVQSGGKCFQINGDYGNLTFENNVVGDCQNEVFNISGTSLGNNKFGPTIYTHASSRDDGTKIVATGSATSDSFPLADAIYELQCTDTGDAAVRAITYNQPAYQNIRVNSLDASGGCDITAGTGFPGQSVRYSLAASTNAQPVRVSHDGGTTWTTLTLPPNPVGTQMTYINTAWRKDF